MKTFQELKEGINDPNIFKAFFLAGGPGSGKSYVVRKTTGGTGLVTINSDDSFERMLKKAGLDAKMPASEEEPRDAIRSRAKKITASRKGNAVDGRLGLLLDGTGRDYDKIVKQSIQLKQLGYETHMIYVNTSLETALQRNAKRDRTVPESIAITSWKDVQSNMGKFSQHFRQNFIIVDNNDSEEDVMTPVFKQIKGLLKNKVTNKLASAWVSMEMKRRGITKRPKGF